ncbi:tRNA(Ile)-lysidine synthetase (EC [Olavius sp. associated proteobacterium Delta 1]|nr:tRNA(Ile)-lysidine synthetase (EC [Olavius sp. associated proteobacterium Delta 1]
MGTGKDRSKSKIEKKILRTVKQTIATHRMLAADDSVLIAVSGGPDSVTLAHVMHTLNEEHPRRSAIAHLNHCLRQKDSDRDAEFVAELARRLNLPCYIEKKDVRHFQRSAHLSLEEAARKMRYGFFEEISARNGFNKIAIGHHSNDNAELVLMNLLRGSGPLGLSGIAPVRGGKIVRPLIQLKRSEIIDYIAEKKLLFVTDASNTDLSFRRNRIRHQLIPELEKAYNPAIIEALNRLATIMRAEDQWLENILSKDFNKCISVKGPDAVSIDLGRLERLAASAKRRIIRRAILSVKMDLRRITLAHIDAVLNLIDKSPAAGCLNLPDGIRVRLRSADLTINNRKSDASVSCDGSDGSAVIDYQYTIAPPGALFIQEARATIKLAELGADDLPDFNTIGKNLAFFDMDRLQFPLVVRNPRPGDRFSPLGVNGTQKVKKYFIDNKIPRPQRRLCPLLLNAGKIIWLAGHRIDNCVKVVSATRRILKAELLLA